MAKGKKSELEDLLNLVGNMIYNRQFLNGFMAGAIDFGEAQNRAYDIRNALGIPTINNSPSQLKRDDIEAALAVENSGLTNEVIKKLPNTIDEISDDPDKFQHIALNRNIQARAGEEYREVVRAYNEFAQASEIKNRELNKLSREELFEVYRVISRYVHDKIEEKLTPKKGADYARRVSELVEIAVRNGNLDPGYLEEGRMKYYEEAKRKLKDSKAKEKAVEAVKKVIEEDVALRPEIAEAIYYVYRPMKIS